MGPTSQVSITLCFPIVGAVGPASSSSWCSDFHHNGLWHSTLSQNKLVSPLIAFKGVCYYTNRKGKTKTALQQGSHRDDNLIRDIIEVPLLEPIETVTANIEHCTNGYFNKWFLCLPTFLPSSPTMLEHLTFIGIRRRKGLRKDGQKPTSSFLSHLPNPNITRERERAEFHLLKGKKLF